jgi:hypothetical protein
MASTVDFVRAEAGGDHLAVAIRGQPGITAGNAVLPNHRCDMWRKHAHTLAIHSAIAHMIALNEIRGAAVLPGVVGMDAAR